jgi:hypothetical protein
MAVKAATTKRPAVVDHISHAAQTRIDGRVKQILTRREAAVRHARLAARRIERPHG